MKKYTAVLMSVTLALAAAGLVSGANTASTTPVEVDISTEIVKDASWNSTTENYVNRLVQMGVPNSGICPTVA
ncbi:MAG: hypothetical protein L7S61_02865 [Acidimicrobiales bacterium]|nr:hypothetical protein [Acidimicrobiales bacterium]